MIVSSDTIIEMTPPFEITPASIQLVAAIERLLGRYEGLHHPRPAPYLRKTLRVRTVHGSVGIEGNTLTEDQITAVLEGQRVIGPRREIIEVRNALAAYDRLNEWHPERPKDLLKAHAVLMAGLLDKPGNWRKGNVGIMRGNEVAHVAPPANRVAFLVKEFLGFLLSDTQTHSLIKAAVVHYELEFIHPFDDGNGRVGRLWHTLILNQFHPLFQFVPIESIVRDRQNDYYATLSQCDRAGQSTAFVEFALAATRDALEMTLSQLAPQPITSSVRLETAREHFGKQSFARKDYLALFPKLSTATASRDLKQGLDQLQLKKTGDQSQAKYVFRSRDLD